MANSSQTKIQHYVPKFILKNFCARNTDQVYVFDKRRERVFLSNIRNAAAEHGFYDLNLADVVYTLEPSLGEIEAKASKIVQRIVRARSLAGLSKEDKGSLSEFIAVQLTRVNRIRNSMTEMNALLEKAIRQLGADPAHADGFDLLSEEDIKGESMDMLIHYHDYVPYIIEKTWVLFKTSRTRPFYTSDNPITFQKLYNFGPRGNLGLASKGIEIYLPISSTLTLGMLCPSYEANLRAIYQNNAHLRMRGLPGIPPNKGTKAWLDEFMNGIETGSAVSTGKENVVNLNSLQVGYSSRFVFSSTSDFDLVREMIKDDPKVKKGICLKGS